MKVTAAPQTIPAFSSYLDNPANNAKEFRTLSAVVAHKRLTPLDSPYPGAEMFNLGNKYFVLDTKEERVVYYMAFEVRTLQGKKAAYQVMVWRSPVPEMSGYASRVFFEELFAHTELITTDRQQTPNGMRFWQSAVSSALSDGLFVYYMDRNTKKVARVHGRKDLEKLTPEIWSGLMKAMGHLLVIAKTPLVEH